MTRDQHTGSTPTDPARSASSRLWRRSPSIAHVETPGRSVILDLAAPAPVPLVLTGTAVSIWQALDGFVSARQLVEGAAMSAGAPEFSVVESAVLYFLEELRAAGLIEIHTDPSDPDRSARPNQPAPGEETDE